MSQASHPTVLPLFISYTLYKPSACTVLPFALHLGDAGHYPLSLADLQIIVPGPAGAVCPHSNGPRFLAQRRLKLLNVFLCIELSCCTVSKSVTLFSDR
jgi:hypothetical protein